VNVEEESAWGDEEPTYYNEGVDIETIRQERDSQIPPPIPPLPDHYSSRPSNLPVAVPAPPGSPAPVTAATNKSSPLYENTETVPTENAYSLAEEIKSDDNSPRHEPWFHGKLTRHDVSAAVLSP